MQNKIDTPLQSNVKTGTKKTYIIASAAVTAILLFSSGWAFGRGNVSLTTLKNGTVNSASNLEYNSVDEVYEALKSNFDGTITEEKVLDGIKSGLANASEDPYTEYFNVDDSKAFNEELNGSFEGIGAELGKENANVVIISPIAGSPAEAAGVRPGDVIVQINGKDASDITITEAVKQIRGAAGTEVALTLARDGQRVDVTIVRAKITMPSVRSEIKDGIGILTISRFSEDTTPLATTAANEFVEAGVKGIVLDMRSNPGGLLNSSVDVSSLWLENGKVILLEKRGDKIQKTFKASGKPILGGIKTVVLINEGSASASEITAGALHDNGVATIIGTKSYGKGSVQQILELPSGGTLKVTVARWFTPNDKNIDKEGITPETEIKITEEDIKNKRDPQLDAALNTMR